MSLHIGIVGLPNVGKSTLFNALTRSMGAQAANYPFCTIDPNIGIVEVPDPRLHVLADLVKPQKVIPAAIEFVDIAGLVRGASKGEGLGNTFLSHIRDVDALCHVVRIFGSGDIIHVEGAVDPRRDREIVETELIIADLDKVTKRLDKILGGARSGDADLQKESAVLQSVQAALQRGEMAYSVQLDDPSKALLRSFMLLTDKPMLYALNVSEQELGQMELSEAKKQAGLRDTDHAILLCAKLEEALIDLDVQEAKDLLASLSTQTSGLDQLIRSAYDMLGLSTYFTVGVKEVRAWTIRLGDTAPVAAGVIHSDFEKNFIRAETISYTDFIACGSELKAKESGKMRVEGKEYVVRDGDILHFR